jgi:hypothetical protein
LRTKTYPQQIAHRRLVIDDHDLEGDSTRIGESSLQSRPESQPIVRAQMLLVLFRRDRYTGVDEPAGG